MSASRHPLADDRWHFQHGPIDLIVQAQGEEACVREGMEQAWRRFQQVLGELVGELHALRQALPGPTVEGAIAQRMVSACMPFSAHFITPMAAVAGAVAEDVLLTLRAPGITRAYVNNGGDIALHLGPGTRFRVGLCTDRTRKQWKASALDGDFAITFASPVRGVATSGWRGRSLSLGIADSVTVLAATAAQADAAATMIANAVNVDSGAVTRRPANSVKDDTDLGDRLVTVSVGALSNAEIEEALHAGRERAQEILSAGHIHAALLTLQECSVSAGPLVQTHHLKR